MMKTLLLPAALLTVAMLSSGVPLHGGTSYYPSRLNDPKAVYLTADNFPVKADGIADDSAGLQQAINKVQETTNQGILFIPAGRYRLTKTIYIWPGIRLIGFGAERPTSADGNRRRDRLQYRDPRLNAAAIDQHRFHRLGNTMAPDLVGAVTSHDAYNDSADDRDHNH